MTMTTSARSPAPRVDFRRLQADVEALSLIGRREDHGLARMAFTLAFLEATQWLRSRAEAAHLGTQSDGALNVHVHLGGRTGETPVVTGSHLDSVPGGGHLDGALGVVVGLECLRRIKELDLPLRRPLELIAFADEEGRFGGMLGSQAVAGLLTPADILAARDLDGVSLIEAMAACGGDAMHALRAHRPPGSIHAFVELHIEQGPVLDEEGARIGVVEGIVGLRRWQARLIGETNHAGTTPFRLRKDAFLGLAEVALQLPETAQAAGTPNAVATIGYVQLRPGAANVIPGIAEFSLDMRDLTEEGLSRVGESVRAMIQRVALRRDLRFEFEEGSRIAPVACAPAIMAAIKRAAGSLGETPHHLPSGAAHDTQIMSRICPVGMIFLPSQKGRSHSAAEWTSWEAIEAGANTLLGTLIELANEP